MSFDDFFRVEAEEEEPEPQVEHRRPEWVGPPLGELGAVVPLGLTLARSDRGVVAASHALVYSSGIQFEVVAHVGGLRRSQLNRIFHEQHRAQVGDEGLPDGFLRFGIELPGGERVSNLGSRRRAMVEEEPSGPLLFQNGGGGGSSTGTTADWSFSYWLWPLPPAGVLQLYCEWPIAEISAARIELEALPLLTAAAGVTRLWSPEEQTGSGPWVSSRGAQYATTVMTGQGTGSSEGPDAEPIAVSRRQFEVLRRSLLKTVSLLDGLVRDLPDVPAGVTEARGPDPPGPVEGTIQ